MDVNEIPVLITTAISPPVNVPFLEMTSPGLRLVNSKAAAFMWASYGIRSLVIVDSTGAQLLSEGDLRQLAGCGIEVEQLSYIQDGSAIVSRGKGYGEGLIIDHALRSSRLIQRAGIFFKSTGKTFVRNFRSIKQIVDQNNINRIFWDRIVDDFVSDGENLVLSGAGYLDTRFFLTDMEFAIQSVVPAYMQSDDRSGSICETLLYRELAANLQAVRCKRPLVSGFCGGSAREYYDGPLGALDGSASAWIGFNGA